GRGVVQGAGEVLREFGLLARDLQLRLGGVLRRHELLAAGRRGVDLAVAHRDPYRGREGGGDEDPDQEDPPGVSGPDLEQLAADQVHGPATGRLRRTRRAGRLRLWGGGDGGHRIASLPAVSSRNTRSRSGLSVTSSCSSAPARRAAAPTAGA